MRGSRTRPKPRADRRVKVQLYGPRSVPRRAALLGLARQTCGEVAALRRSGEICLVFVSDREIAQVNWKFLRHRGPTDVITFQYPSPRGVRGTEMPFGDVYVSLDTAARAA